MSNASNDRPTRFYKYRPWIVETRKREDGTLEEVNWTDVLLRDRKFFCQGPRDFDDPHDAHTGPVATGSPLDIDRFLIETMEPAIRALRASGATSLTQLGTLNTPESREAIAHIAGQRTRRDFRILCLSAVGNDELMWAFYSDYHRGLCLEFDATHPCFAAARCVEYSEKPPATGASVEVAAFAKSRAWASQQEWRILVDGTHHPFPREALLRVIVGYRFPDVQYNSLVETLKRNRYTVQIDQMQRTPGSYRFVPAPRGEVGPIN